jgi:hypothetical protein
METVILVSVLSTIGVVAVLLGVVIAFVKLKGKVDVVEYNNQIRSIYDGMDRNNQSRYIKEDKLEEQIGRVQIELNAEIQSLNKLLDSRCDKLDSKIKSLSAEL